ncbi:hypothetical protein SLA2020_445570 [Shorea laevis]
MEGCWELWVPSMGLELEAGRRLSATLKQSSRALHWRGESGTEGKRFAINRWKMKAWCLPRGGESPEHGRDAWRGLRLGLLLLRRLLLEFVEVCSLLISSSTLCTSISLLQ